MLSTVVIIPTIIIMSSSLSSREFVWTNYNNETGMDSPLYVSMVGLLMSIFSFSGYEGGAHMAEETTNAAASAPKGIINTCLMTALTGFIFLVGLLYAC